MFISQDIYGMDMSKSEHNNTNVNTNDNDGPAEADNEGGDESPEDNNNDENAPLNGGELDEDSMECVICLTDPREVNTFLK